MSYSIQSIAKALCASVCALVLASCGVSKVVIEGSYPTPNVAKLPLTLAVVYDEPLRSFSYIEYSETGAEEFNIASGESHVALFDAVLPAMFQSVVQVASLEDAEALGVDAIFVPAIDEFQLALPQQNQARRLRGVDTLQPAFSNRRRRPDCRLGINLVWQNADREHAHRRRSN